jgi:hypothetical protein
MEKRQGRFVNKILRRNWYSRHVKVTVKETTATVLSCMSGLKKDTGKGIRIKIKKKKKRIC